MQNRMVLLKSTLSLVAILSFLFLAIGSTDSKKSSDPNAWKTEDNGLMAYIMIEDFVKQRLKSPSMAQFPGIFDGRKNHITNLGNQTYLIKSYVDSQNSFGAMMRTNFMGKIQQVSNEKWTLVSLDFQS